MSIFTKWIKTGNVHDFVFLGKEVIATASGNYVLFYNLITKEEKIEYFNSVTRGEGACCLAGHSIVPVFSTAERRLCPKIYVHTYPEIRKVAECKLNKGPNAYLSCCFSGTEYLLSLTTFPNFKLIVWLWRNGEKLASVDTNLLDEVQKIEPSLNASHLVYQFSSTLGKLLTYEIYSYSKKVTVVKNYIKSVEHKIVCVCWTNSSNLLVCDMYENVYMISSDGKKSQLIVRGNSNFIRKNHALILSFNNAFIMVDTNSTMTCYNKASLETSSSESRKATWRIQCVSHPLKMTLARHKEAILIYSENGKILEILLQNNKPELKEIFSDCRKIKFVCSLKPQESHCVLVDSSNYLMLLNILDGNIRAKFKMDQEDEVLCITTHPHISLLGVSTLSGKCICFIVSIENFKILKTIYLQRQPLEKIKFSKNGTALGVTSLVTDNIFLLKTTVNKEVKVFYHMQCKKSIVDFLIYENEEIIYLLILVKTSSSALIGNSIEIYSIHIHEHSFCKSRTIYMNSYYQKLEYGQNNMFDFLGSPYLSKQIHLFKIENYYESISMIHIVSSEHKLRKFDIYVSKNYTVSSGYDGYIILRKNCDLSKCINMFMVHHYQEKGTKYSASLLSSKVIISLGRNGSLVGLICESQKEREDDMQKNFKHVDKLTWECRDANDFQLCSRQTWLELQEQKITEKETREMLPVKTILFENLKELKAKIKKLLDLNERKNMESQLPIATFDLNTKNREEKINATLGKQEEDKIKLQEKNNEIQKMIEYLMENFWNALDVRDCTLVSFNSKVYVNNYSLRRLDKLENLDDFSIELFNTPLSIENIKLNENTEILHPLTIINVEESINKLNDSAYLTYSNDIVFCGSTSFKWIEDDIAQNKLSTTLTDNVDFDFITCRENKLKIFFNKKFEEIKCLKSSVLRRTADRIKRLNECKSELQSVFGIISKEDKFTNIENQPVETLKNVILNIEEEISFESQTNICLNNEDEEMPNNQINFIEKTESSILESDLEFREQKLEQIMDGLLKIRWEDEVKKDVPKPDCLINKTPPKYDKHDIEAIKIYKQKVEQLEADRQKYKLQLESEILSIRDQIQTDVENFDKKMEEFALEKIKIQSAILQEFLSRIGKRKRDFLKEYSNKKIFFIVNNDLVLLENEYKTLTNELTNIEPIVIELKNRYENLNKRDKILEGKFRGEFAGLKQPMVEHLLRQYKRRPRIGQITCTSSTCLAEMNKCIMTGKKSSILPQEYIDFLRGMDALDVMPTSLPPQIDASHWQSLCKLRRNKMEIEIKLRIAALELAEAEQAYFYLQKLSSSLQSKIYFLRNSIEEERLKQSRFLQTPEIQLVLKAAQIEISITGYFSDFDNATVVTYQQLIEVNNEILMEGKKKIAAMRALMRLRKSILFRGWKYQCLFKKLKHLKEHFAVLQNTKIGKKMQNYLVERLENKIRYKDATSCDKMLKSVQKKFQRMLKEEKTGLLRIIAEIKYWRKMNAELITKIEQLSLKRQEQSLSLEQDHLRRRNRIFRKNHLRSIMQRTMLVEKVKQSRNELLNLQTQLELLKLKTYPTLRLKDSYYRRIACLKKNS